MSIEYRVGLLGERGLTRDELATAMRAVGITCVTERLSEEFVDVALRDEGLVQVETEPASIPGLRRLFEQGGGTLPSPIASAAELCVLMPGDCDSKFQIARRIPGVEGWSFKSLSVALAEVEEHCQDTRTTAADVIRCLQRAENLFVGVIFGERRR